MKNPPNPASVLPVLVLLGVAACAPQTSFDDPSPPASAATCNAADFEYLQGEPISVVDTLGTPLTVRVLAADAFVPRDFDPNRLTVTEATDGTVSRVFCG